MAKLPPDARRPALQMPGLECTGWMRSESLRRTSRQVPGQRRGNRGGRAHHPTCARMPPSGRRSGDRSRGFSRGAPRAGADGPHCSEPAGVSWRKWLPARRELRGPVRDPGAPRSEFQGRVGGSRALEGPRRRLPSPPRGRCLYLRQAEARVRSAGRGRGRREGALTAAGPVGTPPARPPEIWGGSGGAESRRHEPQSGVLGRGRVCTQLERSSNTRVGDQDREM